MARRNTNELQLPVTAEWIERVKGVVDAPGMSRSKLARMVGVSPSLITHLLAGRAKVSELVLPISGKLHILSSIYDLLPPEIREIARIMDMLDDESVKHLIKSAQLMAPASDNQ